MAEFVFFHGTNVVMKSVQWCRSSNFDPQNSFGPQDVQNLQDLGVNAVRLGHHWAGAEPVRGQYNQTFLDIMKSQTKLAEDHGIYVLVDVHQDVLAAQFCGHGVPNVSYTLLHLMDLPIIWRCQLASNVILLGVTMPCQIFSGLSNQIGSQLLKSFQCHKSSYHFR